MRESESKWMSYLLIDLCEWGLDFKLYFQDFCEQLIIDRLDCLLKIKRACFIKTIYDHQ